MVAALRDSARACQCGVEPVYAWFMRVTSGTAPRRAGTKYMARASRNLTWNPPEIALQPFLLFLEILCPV
jgi:hypothetical protein